VFPSLDEAGYKAFMEVIGMKKVIDTANLEVIVETGEQRLWLLTGTQGYDERGYGSDSISSEFE
jgi:hypothetical protein